MTKRVWPQKDLDLFTIAQNLLGPCGGDYWNIEKINPRPDGEAIQGFRGGEIRLFQTKPELLGRPERVESGLSWDLLRLSGAIGGGLGRSATRNPGTCRDFATNSGSWNLGRQSEIGKRNTGGSNRGFLASWIWCRPLEERLEPQVRTITDLHKRLREWTAEISGLNAKSNEAPAMKEAIARQGDELVGNRRRKSEPGGCAQPPEEENRLRREPDNGPKGQRLESKLGSKVQALPHRM
jgi:hypothetical protein